jgi:hypothetical protein
MHMDASPAHGLFPRSLSRHERERETGKALDSGSSQDDNQKEGDF